ncbi:hypothetical protein CVS30_14815 [Arthrobacter psychrolactophilus]|uniref:Uncharacterized protein n=1 Tax=Arthrobacter psychrolactophilus TaxID=92442 RepID=A0A2V5ITR4_9MICC|nr:hypothetical protein CVS30_14815 [Arthrobacter psychrolactophilus]
MFRHVCVAIFPVAVVIAFFIDAPLWMKLLVLAWTAIPVLVSGYRLKKTAKVVAELVDHTSNSLPDRTLHAFREHV